MPPSPPSPRRADEPTVRLRAPDTTDTSDTTGTAPPPSSGPSPDLTVSKVLAAGGAAATSAVLGSVLGAVGTVTGAAIGAVASTVAAVLYQRSLERTRVVLGRIRPGATLPRARVSPEETTVLAPVPPPPRRRRRVRAVLLGSLAFVLALVVITGVELARGSTIGSSESGTSVGRVVTPPAAQPEEETAPVDEDTPPTEETGATPTQDADATPTDTDATPTDDADADATETRAPDEDGDPDVAPEDATGARSDERSAG